MSAMSTPMALIRVLCLASWMLISPRQVQADSFLQARPRDMLVDMGQVEETILAEFGVEHSSKIRALEEELSAMYVAMPKTNGDKLAPATVRYMLHRYYVQRHGWFFKGLDRTRATTGNSSSPSGILKDRAPAYVESIFQKRLHGRGFGLHDVAVFVAVLDDLVRQEVSKDMHKVFSSLDLSVADPVSKWWRDMSVKSYLVLYLLGGTLNSEVMQDFEAIEEDIIAIYPDWPSTMMWLSDFEGTYALRQKHSRNPFISHPDTFESTVEFLDDMAHHFGSYQNLECKELKNKLIAMEYRGSGRVPLSVFYSGGLNGDWTFSESVDYLRNLGALDETDLKRPSVVIPNYMTSQTNCLTASGFYAVCCSDECEELLSHLERDIQAPHATPAHITQLVSALMSDTVDAPRNLSSALTQRLDQIAAVHSGLVPLHGRLFAQWMHHAYPRECPFPHLTGSVNPLSPDEWMALHNLEDVEASKEEMQKHYDAYTGPSEEVELPWTFEEELVDSDDDADTPKPRFRVSLRLAVGAAALMSFAFPLVRTTCSYPTVEKVEKYLV
jgi:diadenosine tetraphosphatase ApaH/serine/threonine PP2A family protein phosphatase